jgi:hypothetical protein
LRAARRNGDSRVVKFWRRTSFRGFEMNERTRLHKVNIHKPTLHPDKIEQTFDQSRTDGVRLLASPAPPAADRGHRLPCYRSPDVADGEKRIVGYSTELRQDIYATVFQIARGPGSKITVPESEALRLIQLGACCWPKNYREPPPPQSYEAVVGQVKSRVAS